ncbi:hypothetical protein PILCRDRAFT_829531 [Piloderma croceum F 1598]|uniref:SnoaL-like domain-containing protein n=1 Tax=Piloderma croceum (strain F 1598) TaxID=765440 RepID=A0A0C3EY14_PILCF|nr:hypothetical protein PILCRDRAFT_829531 [Piloderma croceum F 1598]
MSDSCDLTTWAQRHISAIYEAQSEDDLHNAFEAAFSPSLETFVNHEQMSRESIKDDMVQRRAAAISSSVKWENVMVVPKNPEKPDEAGIVAGFLIITRSLRFRIRVSHAQLLTTLTINAKIEQDATAVADEHGDRRRIVHLFMTMEDKRAPIHFPHQRLANSGENDDADADGQT